MIRVAIIEDDRLFRCQAVEFVSRFSRETATAFTVDTYDSSLEFLDGFNTNYDIILLDILMPGRNGFEVAERIRQRDSSSVIIFITSTPQFAIKGYSVNALSYILKPMAWHTFQAEFSRAVEAVEHSDRPSIMLQSGADYYQLPLDEISYIESRQHRITVHADGRDIGVTSTLTTLTEELSPKGFHRINSYYLVNMGRVRYIEGQSCVLDTGETLKIARARKRGFTQALAAHLGTAT